MHWPAEWGTLAELWKGYAISDKGYGNFKLPLILLVMLLPLLFAGPGHASMMTGAPPARTGIINNEWYDRGAATEAYCAGLTKYALVPSTPPAANAKPKAAGTPDRLLSPTVGDGYEFTM
mgnify:CR=1 FL=1